LLDYLTGTGLKIEKKARGVRGGDYSRGAIILILLYIQPTLSFLIGRKHTVNFQNQHLGSHLAADYTIIVSRTLKVTGNHVMYDSGA